ncbi:MAG: hypothetical protein NKF70_12065 [Methanobacterium sp. ERen5]|nr:MAG: hypothetical protein NKF70_12065 [Methanobacterium sp. ERen5]
MRVTALRVTKLATLLTAPPLVALFPKNVLPVIVTVPPFFVIMVRVNVLLSTTLKVASFAIAPPLFPAVLPVNMLLLITKVPPFCVIV